MARTKGAYTYSNDEVLEGLHKHMVKDLCSKYSMGNPTWRVIAKRMDAQKDFRDKVHSIEAQALKAWEKIGIAALMGDNTDFNAGLYKMFVGNKISFQNYADIELEDRIKTLEDQQKKKPRSTSKKD